MRESSAGSRAASSAAIFVALTLLAAAGVACTREEAVVPLPRDLDGRPNAVVLVTIDTVRADHTGLGGYSEPTTPFLDSLARQGVNFTRAYATSSFTPLSMASLVTGADTVSLGLGDAYFDAESQAAVQPVLSDSFTTLAETLQANGFLTVGVPSNRHLSADLGFAQGFEHYYESASFQRANALNRIAQSLLKEALGDDFATAWRQQPLFLWIHYFDPHDPYYRLPSWPLPGRPSADPERIRELAGKSYKDLASALEDPAPGTIEALLSLYDGEIHDTDQQFQKLWEQLGFDDDTLVVFTSDHGEEFLEHGGLGHAKGLYEEVVRVPLMIRWPAKVPQGRVVDAATSILDIYPTLVELLDLPAPENLAGRSLVPLFEASDWPTPRPLVLELDRRQEDWIAWVEGDWKLIQRVQPDPWLGFFDLAADPGEQRNLADEQPERVRAALAVLEAARAASPPPPAEQTYNSIVDEHTIEALKAMGYVVE